MTESAARTNNAPGIPAVAFVGKQNSGKTTLLVKVIAALAGRGIRLATVKHHSHSGFEFDIEGKDSWRHRQAGSLYTVIAAPDQLASVQRLDQELELETIISMVSQDVALLGQQIQLILVEGYRQGGLPTIELFRADNPNDAFRALGGEGNVIIAVVTDMLNISGQASARNLPVFGFDDPDAIADFLITRFLPAKPQP
jgi:molybdopterin-guanine dinucleotide biosynthesis protein MobB